MIFSDDSTKYRRHMQYVLERFKDFKLYVNLKKCEFNTEKIEFLNFIIFTQKVRMNSKRIQIIKEWSKLKIYCKMQTFLKFGNFYERFIYCYFKITALLTSLFKSNENEKKSLFKWLNEIEQTFRQLKNIFMSTSFFIHYNFLKRNRVKIDVFNFVIASILNQ